MQSAKTRLEAGLKCAASKLRGHLKEVTDLCKEGRREALEHRKAIPKAATKAKAVPKKEEVPEPVAVPSSEPVKAVDVSEQDALEGDRAEAYRLPPAKEARTRAEIDTRSSIADCSDSDSWTLVSMSVEPMETSPDSSESVSESAYAWASMSAFFDRIAAVSGAAADRLMGTGRAVIPRGLVGAG